MPDYLPYAQRPVSTEYRDMLSTIRTRGARVQTKQGEDALAVAGVAMRFPMADGAAVITERSVAGFAGKAIGALCALIHGARTLEDLAAFFGSVLTLAVPYFGYVSAAVPASVYWRVRSSRRSKYRKMRRPAGGGGGGVVVGGVRGVCGRGGRRGGGDEWGDGGGRGKWGDGRVRGGGWRGMRGRTPGVHPYLAAAIAMGGGGCGGRAGVCSRITGHHDSGTGGFCHFDGSLRWLECAGITIVPAGPTTASSAFMSSARMGSASALAASSGAA